MFRDAVRLGVSRWTVLSLLALRLMSVVAELVGLAILLPLFQFIQAKGDTARLVEQHREWAWAKAATDSVGIPIAIETLLATSFLLLMLRQLFIFVRLRYEASVKEAAAMRLKLAIFSGFVWAGMRYQEEHAAGAIVTDMTIEAPRAVEQLFSQVATAGVAILVLVYVGGLVVLSWAMTLAAIFVFGLALLAVRRQYVQGQEAGRGFSTSSTAFADFLIERLKQVRLIRLAGTERAEVAELHRLSESQRSSMVRIYNLLANVEVVMEPFVVGAGFALLYAGVRFFGLSLEAIGIYIVILMRLQPVVKEFARYRQGIGSTQSSYQSVFKRLTEVAAAREPSTGTRRFQRVEKGIRFEAVRFTYPGNGQRAALSEISLEFRAQQMSALVGPSGAGKSTLIDMIPRLRAPDSGRVLLDEIPIESLALENLRSRIAYSPQVPHIFDVTAAEHIRYGKPDATFEEVRQAALLAGADEFIRALPQGYDTRCGHGGSRLSGGQRQRLDLARALVRNAPILLLDEPSSNLDADSEAHLRQALVRIRREIKATIIVIAHRLSTIVMADSVVVLEKGRITAVGRHQDLIQSGGWYAEAYRKQAFLGDMRDLAGAAVSPPVAGAR